MNDSPEAPDSDIDPGKPSTPPASRPDAMATPILGPEAKTDHTDSVENAKAPVGTTTSESTIALPAFDWNHPTPPNRVHKELRTSIGTKITISIDKVIVYLTLKSQLRQLWGLALGVLLAFVLTRPVRADLHSALYGSPIIVGTFALSVMLGYILVSNTKIGQLIGFLSGGRWEFGDLRVIHRRQFRFLLGMGKQIRFFFSSQDEKSVNTLRELFNSSVQYRWASSYVKQRVLSGVERARAHSEWEEAWHHEILPREHQGTTFEVSRTRTYAWLFLPLSLDVLSATAMTLAGVVFTVSLWLFSRNLASGHYLPAYQFASLAGFVLGLFAYINVIFGLCQLEIVPNADPLTGIPEEKIKDEWRKVLDRQKGKGIVARLEFGSAYVEQMRNYFVPMFCVLLAIQVVVDLILVVPGIVIDAAFSQRTMLSAYGHMAVGILTIGPVVLASYFVAFILLQRVRSMVSMVAGALVLAMVPVIAASGITGRAPSRDAILAGVLAGAVAALAAAGAERARKQGEGYGGARPEVYLDADHKADRFEWDCREEIRALKSSVSEMRRRLQRFESAPNEATNDD